MVKMLLSVVQCIWPVSQTLVYMKEVWGVRKARCMKKQQSVPPFLCQKTHHAPCTQAKLKGVDCMSVTHWP